MNGNLITKIRTKIKARAYINKVYKDKDYYIDKVNYNFKDNNYYAKIMSKSSRDTYFEVAYDNKVKFVRDTYKDEVLSMWNTANRLNMEYSKLFKDLIEKKFKNNLEFTYANLIFKEEDSKSELTRSSLKLDQHYDVNQLGVNAGYLTGKK